MARINDVYGQYLSTVEFEEMTPEELTTSKLTHLEAKKGVVVSRPDSTQLWIVRKIKIINMLNVPTVMESMLGEYEIRDHFGKSIWEGNTEETLQFVEGYYAPVFPNEKGKV